MALAPLAHVLFTRVMHHDPSDARWPDRDRFVLSAGHAWILLYSMLFLTGYGLELDDLRQFSQWAPQKRRCPITDSLRQRPLWYLGELNDSAQARWLKSIEVYNAKPNATLAWISSATFTV